MLKGIQMFKKVFCLIMVVFCLLGVSACQKKEFRDDTIYLFWQPGCSHCHHAIDFFNNNLSSVRVEMIDISKEDGHQKLLKAVKQYNLGTQIATPLFIVKDNHFMGWADELAEEFTKMAPYFQK